MNDSIVTVTIAPEGFQFPPGKENATTLASRVDEYYFDTMGIPLAAGRNFTRRDDESAPRVAIVNQQLADHYWPNQDPLGKRFRLESATTPGSRLSASRRRARHLRRRAADRLRLPAGPAVTRRANVPAGPVDRRSGRARRAAAEVVRGLDVNMPIFNVRTMEELYRMRAVSIFNVLVIAVGAMGLMGLGLSIVGLYGLVAYAASRRTREIGIRRHRRHRAERAADGATPGSRAGAYRPGVGLAASVGAGGLLSAAFPPATISAISSRWRWSLRSCSPSRCWRPTFRRAAPRASIRSRRCATSSSAQARNLSKKVFRGSLRHHRGQRNLPVPRISRRREHPVDGLL